MGVCLVLILNDFFLTLMNKVFTYNLFIAIFNRDLKGITFIKMFIPKQLTQNFMHTNANNSQFFEMKFLY